MNELFEEPKQINEGMKQGLARMYGDSFMREYLVNAIAIAKNNCITFIESGKIAEAQAYASRAKSLTQLLEKGKQHFVHFEEVARNLKEPLKGMKNIKEVKI